MSASRQARAATLAVLENRAFLLLWIGQLVSGMGSALTTLASSILIFRITNSALSVGLMLIATAAPTIFVGLLAGVFVDRYDRKRILVAADILRAILIFLIPSLVPLSVVWLYVMVALSSAVAQFFDSALASVLPELATDEQLSAANALMAISSVGSTTVGFAAAGMLASGADINLAYYANSATFAVSGVLIFLSRMPASPNVEDTSIRAIARNLRSGLLTVRDVPSLRSLFVLVMPIFLIFGLQNSLFLPFALKTLGGSEFQVGLQQASEAVGIALGSLAMTRVADKIREGEWLVLSYVFMALAGIAYSFSRSMGIAIFLIGVAGFVNAPSFIGRQLVIQRATPRELRGRVNSAFFVVRDVMFVVGMSMAGLADIVSLRLLLFLSSLGLLAAGAAGFAMPGLGQPAAEWKRRINLLFGVEAAPRLGAGIPASIEDIDRFISHRPELQGMSEKERRRLAGETHLVEAPGGKIVIYRGETSDAAYFILRGSVDVGYIKDDEYVILNTCWEGDFFGEIAALTSRARTANVITEEESEFLIIPSKVLRRLADRYATLREVFYTTIAERLSVTDLPIGTTLDQDLLRELRTDAVESN